MRIFERLGIADDRVDELRAIDRVEWFGADRRIVELDLTEPRSSRGRVDRRRGRSLRRQFWRTLV